MIGEGQDGRVEGCVFIFSCENSKITTHCWTTIDRRMLHPTKKRCPTSKGKEKPQKEGRRGEITFRLKPHIHQWCSKGSDKTMSAPGSRDPPRQRLSQTYVWVYYCGEESLRRNGLAIIVNKRVQNGVLGCNLKNDRMISVRFPGKPFNITVMQAYAPITNAEEAEWFNEDLQDLLELIPKKISFSSCCCCC